MSFGTRGHETGKGLAREVWRRANPRLGRRDFLVHDQAGLKAARLVSVYVSRTAPRDTRHGSASRQARAFGRLLHRPSGSRRESLLEVPARGQVQGRVARGGAELQRDREAASSGPLAVSRRTETAADGWHHVRLHRTWLEDRARNDRGRHDGGTARTRALSSGRGAPCLQAIAPRPELASFTDRRRDRQTRCILSRRARGSRSEPVRSHAAGPRGAGRRLLVFLHRLSATETRRRRPTRRLSTRAIGWVCTTRARTRSRS